MRYDVIGKTPVTQAWLMPFQEIVLAKFGNLLISDIHNYFTAEYAVGLLCCIDFYNLGLEI